VPQGQLHDHLPYGTVLQCLRYLFRLISSWEASANFAIAVASLSSDFSTYSSNSWMQWFKAATSLSASSQCITSTRSHSWNSPHSSLYFSISSFVCLIFYFMTLRKVPCCMFDVIVTGYLCLNVCGYCNRIFMPHRTTNKDALFETCSLCMLQLNRPYLEIQPRFSLF
jgi:hypothetical protein